MLRQSLPQGNIWPLPTTMISLRPTPCTPWAKPFCSCGRRASRTASSTAMKHSFPRASSGPWWPTSSRITPRTTCCAATTSATWRCSKRRCGMRSAGSGRSATQSGSRPVPAPCGKDRRRGPCTQVLYYWRVHAGSTSGGTEAKPYVAAAAKKALADHLARTGRTGNVEDGLFPSTYRVKWISWATRR